MSRHTGIQVRVAKDGTKTFRAEVYSARDHKKIRRSFPTEAAARQWRADAASAVSRGALRSLKTTTVREAVEAFYAGARDGSIRNKQGLVYKASVVRRWEGALNAKRDSEGRAVARRLRGDGGVERHGFSFLDEIGARRLADIDRNDLQSHVERMLGWGLDPSSVRNTINALRPVFRRAVNRGDLLVNPTTGLEIPTPRGKRLRVADPVEAEQLIATVGKTDQALLATACYAGLRLGELQALRWECVDLATGVIRVEWSYDPKERDLRRREVAARATATSRSQRCFAITCSSTSSTPGAPATTSSSAGRTTPVHRGRTFIAEPHRLAARGPQPAWLPRGSAHVREPDDRRRCERESDLHLHGPRVGEDHARPVRAPVPEQRIRGCRSARRVPRAGQSGASRGPVMGEPWASPRPY